MAVKYYSSMLKNFVLHGETVCRLFWLQMFLRIFTCIWADPPADSIIWTFVMHQDVDEVVYEAV